MLSRLVLLPTALAKESEDPKRSTGSCGGAGALASAPKRSIASPPPTGAAAGAAAAGAAEKSPKGSAAGAGLCCGLSDGGCSGTSDATEEEEDDGGAIAPALSCTVTFVSESFFLKLPAFAPGCEAGSENAPKSPSPKSSETVLTFAAEAWGCGSAAGIDGNVGFAAGPPSQSLSPPPPPP